MGLLSRLLRRDEFETGRGVDFKGQIHDATEWKWGQHVSYFGPTQHPNVSRVWGHWPARFEDGDGFLMPAASGGTGRFILSNIDWKMNPADMFFADAICVGYEDDKRDEERVMT